MRLLEVWMRVRCGPPGPIKWFRKHVGGDDYDTQVAEAFRRAEEIPFVRLEPVATADGPVH